MRNGKGCGQERGYTASHDCAAAFVRRALVGHHVGRCPRDIGGRGGHAADGVAVPAGIGQRSVCTRLFDHTLRTRTGRVTSVKYVPAKPTKVDCFYVYPTTSDQPGPQANFDIDPELRSIALYQATRYASECRVFAPVYRQITLSGLFGGKRRRRCAKPHTRTCASAWLDYLAHDNAGRGVVFIGHSQGAGCCGGCSARRSTRSRRYAICLVSAILLGGNVTVKKG